MYELKRQEKVLHYVPFEAYNTQQSRQKDHFHGNFMQTKK
jgi:hypothetical protein